MTPEKWTVERRRRLTREALVASAREVFARRGFHAASLEEIADAAGFTRGAVYSNFENKEDLFFAVLDRHVEVQLASFDALLADSGGPTAIADEDVVRQLAAHSDPEWIALGLEFRLYALRNPDVRDRLLARYRGNRDRIVSYLEEVLRGFDQELLVPAADLAAIVDWGAGGIMELGLVDPDQAHVLGTFLDILNRGAFRPNPAPGPGVRDRTPPRSGSGTTAPAGDEE